MHQSILRFNPAALSNADNLILAVNHKKVLCFGHFSKNVLP